MSDRFNRLTDLMNEIQLKNHEDTIGKRYEVLVESFNEDNSTVEGRNEYGRSIVFDGSKKDIGRILTVEIDKVNTFTSYGKEVR